MWQLNMKARHSFEIEKIIDEAITLFFNNVLKIRIKRVVPNCQFFHKCLNNYFYCCIFLHKGYYFPATKQKKYNALDVQAI